VHRIKRIASAKLKLAIYIGSGVVTGCLVGVGIGLCGGRLAAGTRAELAAVLAVLGVALASVGLCGFNLRPLQFDRETPYGWLGPGPIVWAVRNGSAIGLGAFTRIGFWLWYVVPCGALISGSTFLGAAGYGLYALVRTGAAGILMATENRGITRGLSVLGFSERARKLANGLLLGFSLATLVVVGL
jgi:hypothetical protein